MSPLQDQEKLRAACQQARQAVLLEAQALQELAAVTTDVRFYAALELILSVQGRLIVTGMGKSGHIGGKIAATLASTGTPSFFIHPGEASHGDLGMLQPQDALLAISNSGETNELADLIAFTRRFGVPLLGMTSCLDSTLARHCDIVLALPAQPEACPMGLAPTTSTTMALALGDALAIGLLYARDFTPGEFRRFHPGGKLGQKLLTVEDIMHRGPRMPLCRVGQSMADTLLVMSEKSFGCVGIVQEEALCGILTDGDLRRWVEKGGLLTDLNHQIMTSSPKTVPPDALIEEALALLNRYKLTGLFVCGPSTPAATKSAATKSAATKRPVGFVHIHDCLRAGSKNGGP